MQMNINDRNKKQKLKRASCDILVLPCIFTARPFSPYLLNFTGAFQII